MPKDQRQKFLSSRDAKTNLMGDQCETKEASPFQTGGITIKQILIPWVCTWVCKLPEGSESMRSVMMTQVPTSYSSRSNSRPASRKSPNSGCITRNPQGIVPPECSTISRAGCPPVSGGIDNCLDGMKEYIQAEITNTHLGTLKSDRGISHRYNKTNTQPTLS